MPSRISIPLLLVLIKLNIQGSSLELDFVWQEGKFHVAKLFKKGGCGKMSELFISISIIVMEQLNEGTICFNICP